MLIKKAKDPVFWEKVRTAPEYRPFIDELLLLWDKYCATDERAIKYTEYRLFTENGSRREYEASYFHRRCALNASALLCMIYPDRAEYFDKLCDIVWAICDEYTWVLPAHAGSLDSLNSPIIIDLFSAETGGTLCEIDYILQDRLPPVIRRRISECVRSRIIESYLNRHYGWEESANNWAAVCCSNVTAAFLYLCPELYPLIRARVERTVRCFLSGFDSDGMCEEGFGYWHYGFGCFVCLSELLRDFTGGKTDYFADAHVAKIAAYPQAVMLGGGAFASFADSGDNGKMHIGLAHYLKHEYPDLPVPERSLTYTNDSCGRWQLHLRALLWFDSELTPEEQDSHGELWAPGNQLFVKKTPLYSFACKGGHNAESHNHNDLGSFIIARDGASLLCDPGSGVYTARYFGAERYEDFCTSSRGHSVPTVNGKYQSAGRAAYAVSSYEDGILTMDISRAYGEPEGSVVRSFAFDAETVTLTDTFSPSAGQITERLVTGTEPTSENGSILVGSVRLLCEGIAAAQISPAPKENLWCIDIPVSSSTFTLTVKTV